jgi:hypothetical protein
MSAVRVYTEAEIPIALDRCSKGNEGFPVLIRESHEELRHLLATSEAARERAEELLHDCWEQFAVEDKYGKCAGGLSVLEDLLDHFAHTEEGKG